MCLLSCFLILVRVFTVLYGSMNQISIPQY